jgi:hypothetical protein
VFYLFFFIILSFFSFFEIANLNKKSHNILILFSWLILVLIAGLRYETGGDWDSYTLTFKKINPILEVLSGKEFGDNREIGYVLFCSVIKQLGGSIQTVYFFSSLINITLITKSLRLYTKYTVLGLLVYYCNLYFSLDMLYTRQSMAISISFYAIRYIKKESFLKYLLFTLMASSFHFIALLMIPCYFILKKRLYKTIMITSVFAGCILMGLGISWLTYTYKAVLDQIGRIADVKGYYGYILSNIFAVNKNITIGFFLNFILFVIFIYNNRILKKKYGSIFLNMFFVSLVIYYYGYELVEFSNRVYLTFLMALIVMFPLLLEHYSVYINRLFFLFFIISYCFLIRRSIFLEYPDAIAYNPYQNYVIYTLTRQESTGRQRLEKSHNSFRRTRTTMGNQ